ncbi:hypothetical protein EON80_19885, partial [bacterium]
MSQQFSNDAPQYPTTPPTVSGLTRRNLLGGSAALLGSALLARPGLSQLLEAATATPGAARKVAGVPHEFGLLRKPVQSKAPLAPSPFLALPLGSVQARGWLLKQLELQRDGLTGRAAEVYDLRPVSQEEGGWSGGERMDWEKDPYYLKGLVALAYTLDDAGLKATVQSWTNLSAT